MHFGESECTQQNLIVTWICVYCHDIIDVDVIEQCII